MLLGGEKNGRRRLTSINYGHQFHDDRWPPCHAAAEHKKKEPSEVSQKQRDRERETENVGDRGRVTGILKVIQNKQFIEKWNSSSVTKRASGGQYSQRHVPPP